MKLKAILLFSLLSCVVLTAGCLNESGKNDSLNPLNKNIEPYQTSFGNKPHGEDIIFYRLPGNVSYAGNNEQEIILKSDLAFYGTLKTIGPSYWSTADQNPPPNLQNMPIGTYFSSEWGEFNVITNYETTDIINTVVVFEVNDVVKGRNVKEVHVVIEDGQVGNYVMYEPLISIWDLKEGQQYLVYLKKDGTGNYTIMPPRGIFVVLDEPDL